MENTAGYSSIARAEQMSFDDFLQPWVWVTLSDLLSHRSENIASIRKGAYNPTDLEPLMAQRLYFVMVER